MRAGLRVHRRGLALSAPWAAERAAGALDPVWLSQFKVAAVYHPLGSEFDPTPLALRLEAQGIAVALPVVVARDGPLAFRLRVGALAPDRLGLPAPPPGAREVRPDLVVLPLLAFDAAGARLGQGGGYYDRTLQALRESGRVFALGLGYAGQAVDGLPVGAHDQRLDGMLTEEGLRLFPQEM